MKIFNSEIDYFLLCLLALLSVLSFLNLGNQYLWQDEAENALVARNILMFGYPRAFDGTLLLVSDIGYRAGYTWIAQPWLQNYVTAFSFFFLGQSTFTARLPFTLIGISAFLLSYYLARRLFSRRVARVSSVILLTCVPFLLMIRQARYYSLALFLALLLIWSYLDYAERKKHAGPKIVIFSFLLFNTNFGMFFPLALALALHYLAHYFKKKNIRKDVGLLLWTLAVTAPVFIFFKGWSHEDPFLPGLFLHNIKFYLRSINAYVAPIRLMLIVYLALAVIKRKFIFFKIDESDKKSLSCILFIFVTVILSMGAAKSCRLRYAVHLIPLVIIFESYFLSRWMDRNKVFPVICIILLITTDLFNHSLADILVRPFSAAVAAFDKKAPEIARGNKVFARIAEKAREDLAENSAVTSYLGEYVYEITHDYDGPVEGIVEFLRKNAKIGDTVLIPYGDYAVAFYTGLKVDNRMEPQKNYYPEWVVPRDYWTGEDFYNSDYFGRIKREYKKIVLEAPDLIWENRPDDMGYHKFRTVKNYPKKVVIYAKEIKN